MIIISKIEVILVDKEDNAIGKEEKVEAHKKALLHRAFSVFVFNSKKELLLQKRAIGKYQSAGLWANTCCSHPRKGEDLTSAAHRRLKEELGFDCDIKEIFSFKYKTRIGDLFENEYNHVLMGTCDAEPNPNPEEVESWKWIGIDELVDDMRRNPDSYSYWFKECVGKVVSFRKN